MSDPNVVIEPSDKTGDRTTDRLYRLPSLDVFPGGISLEVNINPRRGEDVDLHPPLLGLHLQTLATKQKVKKIQKFSQEKEKKIYIFIPPHPPETFIPILFSRCPCVRLCVSPRRWFFLISWKRSDGYSSISADTLISVRCTYIRESKG